MSLNDDAESQLLSTTLCRSTAAIDERYIHLGIDGGAPIYRERVYCYELYHQMRKRWPRGYRYVLNAEVDKRAHPILRELNAEFYAPDFLVHTPGAMAGNYAIIEVKHALAARQGIVKDLETLDRFVSNVGYRRAIYLIYGRESDDALQERVAKYATEIGTRAPIELWMHAGAGQAAVHTRTLYAA